MTPRWLTSGRLLNTHASGSSAPASSWSEPVNSLVCHGQPLSRVAGPRHDCAKHRFATKAEEMESVSDIIAKAPMNPAILLVAIFVIAAALISFGNTRQRRVLWPAVLVCALMVLLPPWCGERGSWVAAPQTPEHQDVRYVRSKVPVGYAPLFKPPKGVFGVTDKSIGVHWSRLLAQLGFVACITGATVVALRGKLPKREPRREP